MNKKGKRNTSLVCVFGNKKRRRKEKRRINMLSFVWFVKRNEMKDIYFLFLNLSEFERDKFKIF